MSTHHFFVPEFVDANAQRSAAIRAGRTELAVLHLHPYVEEFDGCQWNNPDGVFPPSSHEMFGEDVTG